MHSRSFLKALTGCAALLLFACAPLGAFSPRPSLYIDPFIGAADGGNVVVCPCTPFSMVHPSPDCGLKCNSGWKDISHEVLGFSQTHVSGTGGSPKYGNVLIQPFTDDFDVLDHSALRESEDVALGYYSATYAGSRIRTEITSAARAALYRITFPKDAPLKALAVNAGHCVTSSKDPSVKEKKFQWVMDAEVAVLDGHSLEGYTTVEGGWGGGDPYTVFFYIETDSPFKSVKRFERGINLEFDDETTTLEVRVGISFVSAAKARENTALSLGTLSFEQVRRALVKEWDSLLGRVRISPFTPKKIKRIFYTALYHTFLMPSDRCGEWNECAPEEPYYDDFYTLWDTYRTSFPLITLVDEARMVEIINSMLTIYRHDGYMPDGRSGNSPSSVQGGSCSDIVVCDAFLKGVEGIDYDTAFEAMLKNGTLAPGGPRPNSQGREAVELYLKYGYVPCDLASKAGNRTIDYAYCDYCIAKVAEGLGRDSLANVYYARSQYWRNIWNPDAEVEGIKGFLCPRPEDGQFRDSAFVYNYGMVCTDPAKSLHRGWNTFFYEANSIESSLCVPHDIEGLIELCGGPEAFYDRLELCFSGYIDAGNEPSFLSSCLYHWIGRPDKSGERIASLMQGFDDTPSGIPGNDDSGAMSSWYAFHAMGLYPNAGQPYYLIHTPVLRRCTISLSNGRTFTVRAPRLSAKRRFIAGATLRGRKYEYSAIDHSTLMQGGTLKLKMRKSPSEKWGKYMFP